MGRTWDAERRVDRLLATDLIRAAFPGLGARDVSLLGEGWDNIAYVVDGEVVVRFPRRAVAVGLVLHEARLLPVIAPMLPLAIPVPRWIGEPGPRFDWPFAGYRMLPGRTADRARLDDAARGIAAAPLGAFLRALHAIPPRLAESIGTAGDTIGRMDFARRQVERLSQIEALAARGLIDGGRARALAATGPTLARGTRHALVHGDLYARHLLVDGQNRLVGVIDWGDAHLGDPAIDIAAAHALLPPAAHAAFADAYGPIDAATWERARLRALSHVLNELDYACDTDDADLRDEAIGALARLGLAGGNG